MKKFLTLLCATSLITAMVACNDTEGDGADTGLGDTSAAPDATDDVDDSGDAQDNGHQDWPGQEMDEDPLDVPWDMPVAEQGLRFLVANVGNIDFFRCNDVAYNLCWTEQEEIVTEEIAARQADVILLQEVVTPAQCDALDTASLDEDHVCHPDYRPDEPEQVRRLVGPDYTIACDAREGYECVAARVGAASIVGCEDGQLCRQLARTGDPVDGCDPGFTVSAVTLEFDGQTLDVVNVHPPSGLGSEAQQCRHDHFLYFFEEDSAIIDDDDVLVGGDFNFDPYRSSSDHADVSLWDEYVSTSFEDTRDDPRRFAYHSGLPEHDPPYYTAPLIEASLDHLISNSLRGRCITLGAHPGEPPLDRFHGDEIERLDHLALECVLEHR